MTKIRLKSKQFRIFLVTQFFGAFNDNAFKLVISLLAINLFLNDPVRGARYVTLAGAMFILPFVLFSAYAGYLADRFRKKTIIIWSKVGEAVVMTLGLLAFFAESIPMMLFVLFLMGTQSAFFSPAKYGILPEMLEEEDLSKGNGYLQMWTFLAIILGTAVGGHLLKLFGNVAYRTSFVFIAIAIVGTITSFFVTETPSAGSQKKFEVNFLKDIWENIKDIRKNRTLFLCIMGGAYFWFLGAIFQMNILLYAKNMMHISDTKTGLLLTAIALGIGTGSVLAGKWSYGKVEFGLVPLGAIGLGIFSIFLSFSFYSYILTFAVMFFLGMNFGFFSIPLSTYVQQKSPSDKKGRNIATNNFISFSSMLLSSAVLWLLRDIFRINSAIIFMILGLSSFFVIAYICKLLPDFLLRFIAWLIIHTFYRIKIVGSDNVPKEGGALLICNHVSYLDGFLVLTSNQRFIRFIVGREFCRAKGLRSIARIMKVIPISSKDGPKKIIESLEKAREDLRSGELVCIFAEGGITRTGNLLPFGKGLERIMKDVDVPIVPVHLDHVWGSIFSFEGGKFFKKMPSRIPYPITISFGKRLSSNATAFQVRQAVSELASDALKYRKSELEHLPIRFYKQAKKHPFKLCMADSTGQKLTYITSMIGSMVLSRAIRRKCSTEDKIGILLPNSCAAAIVNVAVSLLGKCPVNLNFTASQESIAKAIKKCDIKHIFTSRRFIEKIKLPILDEMVWMEEFKKEITFKDKLICYIAYLFLPMFCLRKIFFNRYAGNIDHLATIMFSSGSTGEPKGVMLSHANINSNIEGLYQVFRAEKQDTIMGILPLFHSFGFTGTLWYPLSTGMSVVYHHNPLDFKVVGKMVDKHKATILMATPTFLMGYIRKCTPEQFKSLRFVIVGAEKLKDRIREAFNEKFGLNPLEGYGCTELSPIVSINIPDVRHGRIRQVGQKEGTIGHPLPGVSARIVNPENYQDLPPGEDGLLLIKGSNVMQGYLNDEAKTQEVMRGDWYVTGDIAMLDGDGFITIKDRLSRFSKIGGEMVPHIRIEEEIHGILEAATEQMCAVTSVPDEKKGEMLVVLFKGDVDIDRVWEKLNKLELPKLWIPKKGSFYKVEEIPVLGSGKLDLKKIKSTAMDKSGISQA